MKLSKDAVKHVAKLANLPLTDAQIEEYGDQLSKILDYVELLNTVDTSDVEPTFNISLANTVWREDQEETGLLQEEALKNAASIQNSCIVTKGVFKE